MQDQFTRYPVMAGRFYPSGATELSRAIDALSAPHEKKPSSPTPFICMLPHAGYVYSGSTTAATIAGISLPRKLIILCPNHTGNGHPLGVWPKGRWRTPFGDVPVDGLAMTIASTAPFSADTASHLYEHSIEVILPFLQKKLGVESFSIVPVCLGTDSQNIIRMAAEALFSVLQDTQENDDSVGIVVSSDMNHFDDLDITNAKDDMALQKICEQDPWGLLSICRAREISMCGAAPMALALETARLLRKGASASRAPAVIMHDTSATASGDTFRVVGYAGVHIWM